MTIPYGIHFSMSDADYRAIPALSASGMKHLRASPLDFWVRSPMNPNLADVLAEEGSTEAKDLGQAFDVRIISGKDAFAAQYAEELVPADFPSAMRTLDDLKAKCREYDVAVSGSKAALIERLRAAGCADEYWDDLLAAHREKHDGKHFLSPKWIAKIHTAAALIEGHPKLSKAFTGGAPQVSIIWRCPKIGVDCKARLDYLKPQAIVDLKTLQNVRGLPVAQAVNREIANRRYHLQAAFYLEAAQYAAQFIKEGNGDMACEVGVDTGLAANHPKTFLWVFQVKGVAPVAIGRILPSESMMLQSAQAEIEAHKQTYRACLEHYGPNEPWVAPTEIETLQDDDIPGWMWQ